MQTQDAYNDWAKTYDTVKNKTRDLEARAIRNVLSNSVFNNVLEIGSGTGKNTLWLAQKSEHITAIDFSKEMLQVAQQKIILPNVKFTQFDITQKWTFDKVDLITCSLVLEHIKDIFFIFQQAASMLHTGGNFYLCELHPYKQMQGARAKFEKDGAMMELEYFVHHLSEYFEASKQNGFTCNDLREWFDDDEKDQPPRLISFLFEKI